MHFNMTKSMKQIGLQLAYRVNALKKGETYLYLASGFLLIAGLIFPDINFLFYLSFVYPVYKVYRQETSIPGFLYYLLPYFLVVGIGTWNNIFPYYSGIILAVLLADLFAVLTHKAVTKIDLKSWSFLRIPILFFIYDYSFHELPFLQMIQVPSIMSSLYNHAFILKASSVWGSHTVLLAVLTVISGITHVIMEKRFSPNKLAAVFCAITMITLPLLPGSSIVIKDKDEKAPVKITAVQGSFNLENKHFDSYLEAIGYRFNYYKELIKDEEADIFVFPEVELGVYDTQNIIDKDFRTKMIDLAREKNALMLFTMTEGNSVTKSKKERFVSSLLISKDGIVGKSSKRNLVPIGETGRYSSGRDYEVFDTIYGKIGISICYDVNYNAIRKLKENGADIILAPFNDNGFSPVFHRIHRYDAVIQSAVNRVPIVMANENGISQLLDETGYVLKEMGIDKKGTLSHIYNLQSTNSYYMVFGRFTELLLFLAAIVVLVLFGTISSFNKYRDTTKRAL